MVGYFYMWITGIQGLIWKSFFQGIQNTTITGGDCDVCSMCAISTKTWLANCHTDATWSQFPEEAVAIWQEQCAKQGLSYISKQLDFGYSSYKLIYF